MFGLPDPQEAIVAHIVQGLIDDGQALCENCGLPINNLAETVVETCDCGTCWGKLWHRDCLTPEDHRRFAHTMARANWRFN